jgi:hypothetical protein
MITTKPENVTYKKCSNCEENKTIDKFYTRGSICCQCNNNKRRQKYRTDEEYRKQTIKSASEFKRVKVVERQKIKEEQQEKIGLENKQCNYCSIVKHKDRFRYNRLKCKDCEREEPKEKFKRYIRTRIYNCLKNNKNKSSVEYLGCSSDEYFRWIFNNNNNYLLENYGKEWHVDHVIPISKFNLNNSEEQLTAFNWRNTMPLSCKENLSKNNKIIKTQVEEHYKKLIDYHIENKLDLPQVFIDLFAKHLDDGNPLKLSLPLIFGNNYEDHD